MGLNICINAQSRLFRLLIMVGAFFRTDFHFYLVNSSVDEKSTTKKYFGTRNVEVYYFFNLYKDLVFLSEMDVIISSTLHLGIAFMSMNKPFLSVDPKNKTKMLMSNLQLERYILWCEKISTNNKYFVKISILKIIK